MKKRVQSLMLWGLLANSACLVAVKVEVNPVELAVLDRLGTELQGTLLYAKSSSMPVDRLKIFLERAYKVMAIMDEFITPLQHQIERQISEDELRAANAESARILTEDIAKTTGRNYYPDGE